MPLINQPNLNIGNIDIQPGFQIDPNTIASCSAALTVEDGKYKRVELFSSSPTGADFDPSSVFNSIPSRDSIEFFCHFYGSGTGGVTIPYSDMTWRGWIYPPENLPDVDWVFIPETLHLLDVREPGWYLIRTEFSLSPDSSYSATVTDGAPTGWEGAFDGLSGDRKNGHILQPGGYWESSIIRPLIASSTPRNLPVIRLLPSATPNPEASLVLYANFMLGKALQ